LTTVKPHKGDILDLPVDTLAFGGKGVARIDDFVVFVGGAVPGDMARVSITKTKNRYAEARLLELIEPSPDRVAARCPSFGTCGGCAWQDLDYGVQLDYKARQVRESLEHLGGLKGFHLLPALGMADPWRYRNRVDFAVGMGGSGAVVGFRPPGRWDSVLPLTECHLLGPVTESVRSTVETWLREKSIPGWDPRTNSGLARHLLVRSAQRQQEVLVSLVTGSSGLPDAQGLVDRLRVSHPQVVGVVHAVNEGRAEVSSGLPSATLWGRPFLLEQLAGITLKVSVDAFFQTNTLMAHALFAVVAREVHAPLPGDCEADSCAAGASTADTVVAVAPAVGAPSAGVSELDVSARDRPVIWDLYSGVGSIGLSLAERAKAVLGIEAVPAAVGDARENARLNGIENAHFVEGDVRRVLRELAQGARTLREGLGKPDVIVVDPPRAGLSSRVVFRIGELGAPRIVYVSCNPSTMAPNIAELQEHGYRLVRVTPVDMFPHTPHVEAVGLLVRERSGIALGAD
jgi:23S rRNA (uracil1939-C5)-methyltransferase